MSLNLPLAFVLEYVQDIQAVKRFYVETFGLQVERESPEFVQLKDQGGARYALASDAPLIAGQGPELYWIVDDAEAAFRELSSKAEVHMPIKQTDFGKVFAIKDPAGQPQFLVEFSRDRPSKPVS